MGNPSLEARYSPPHVAFRMPSLLSEAPETQGFVVEDDMRVVVSRMEAMQAQQRSPQQPNPELDAELARVLTAHPEWRPRMAVATKSALLRKKILSTIPSGGRAVGSAALGSTHPWRSPQTGKYMSDHNWPAAALHKETGMHYLVGGDSRHDKLLRNPAHKLSKHPLLKQTPCHSVPRAKRFPGTTESGELDVAEVQRRGNPGPGSYFKSQPRGTGFSVDGGETVVLGANHVCPWKKCLGHHINPVHVDGSSMRSTPCWSFAKTSRSISETAVGHGRLDGGPVKTDAGCLNPGPIYEHHGTMRPSADTFFSKTMGMRRRARSTTSLTMTRMERAPPEDEAVETYGF